MSSLLWLAKLSKQFSKARTEHAHHNPGWRKMDEWCNSGQPPVDFFFYLISVFYYEMTGCHRNLFLLDFLYIFVHLFNFVWHRVAFHMQLFHFIHQLVSSPNCKKISLFISMTNLGCWYFKSLILHTRKCTFHYHVSISVNRAQY